MWRQTQLSKGITKTIVGDMKEDVLVVFSTKGKLKDERRGAHIKAEVIRNTSTMMPKI